VDAARAAQQLREGDAREHPLAEIEDALAALEGARHEAALAALAAVASLLRTNPD